jgi:hypothetical protein
LEPEPRLEHFLGLGLDQKLEAGHFLVQEREWFEHLILMQEPGRQETLGQSVRWEPEQSEFSTKNSGNSVLRPEAREERALGKKALSARLVKLK